MEKKKPQPGIDFEVAIPDLSTAFDTPRELPEGAPKTELTDAKLSDPGDLYKIFS